MEEVKFNLTQSQIRKLAHAITNNIDITLRLNNKDISPSGVPLILTKWEINKLGKGNSHNINFNKYRLERMKKNGGFIQALLPFLPAVLGGVSAITGIAKNIKDMTTSKKGDGLISDLNIPIVSPLAKIICLGTKGKKLVYCCQVIPL